MTYKQASEIDTSKLTPGEAGAFFIMASHDYMLYVADLMTKYGGSFVVALAECYRRADGGNKTILLSTFTNYFLEYTPDKWKGKEV